MDTTTVWWVLAVGVATLELLTGGFFLLMLALGLVAGALAAHAGLGLSAQLLCAAAVGGGAVAAWGAWRKRQPQADAHTSPDVQQDIGQTVAVNEWQPDGTAAVRHRGVWWQAVAAPGTVPQPGPHRIVAVEGSRLVLSPPNP